MGVASVFPGRSGFVCPRRGATSAKSRSTCADCDNCTVVADVRAARSNAERYLVWGAVVSAVALGVSVRLSIIHFIISAASTAMIVHVMLVDKSSIRRCARLTCCTTFGHTHRFWCLFVWLFTSGMRSVGGFRRFDVEPLKRARHLRSRSDQSRRKPESALAHSALDKA